eukprot:GHVP01027856.1.p2 GENE.GHVP01027856.1~~GHVP01027856.1.p2  ORF type:complete len:417 (+),score=75.58 GHVP01027856.1:3-1253(+)
MKKVSRVILFAIGITTGFIGGILVLMYKENGDFYKEEKAEVIIEPEYLSIDLEKGVRDYHSGTGVSDQEIQKYIENNSYSTEFYDKIMKELFRTYEHISPRFFDVHFSRSSESVLRLHIKEDGIMMDRSYLHSNIKDPLEIGEYKSSIEVIRSIIEKLPNLNIEVYLSTNKTGRVHEPTPLFSAWGSCHKRTRLPFPSIWSENGDMKEWISNLRNVMKKAESIKWETRNNTLFAFVCGEERTDDSRGRDETLPFAREYKKYFKYFDFEEVMKYSDIKQMDKTGELDWRIMASKYVLLEGINKIAFGSYYRKMFGMKSVMIIRKDEKRDHDVSFFGMKEWYHYIPAPKTPKEIYLLVHWLQKNDDIAKRIAENGFWYFYGFNSLSSYSLYSERMIKKYSESQRYIPTEHSHNILLNK